jgi:hypothetical protein
VPARAAALEERKERRFIIGERLPVSWLADCGKRVGLKTGDSQ